MNTSKQCAIAALMVILGAMMIFADSDEDQGIEAEVDTPAGTVPISVPLSAFSAGHVQPGYLVDLFERYSGPEKTQEVTKILLTNVLVLGFGERPSHNGATDKPEKTITLAIQPAYTNLIITADKTGALRFTVAAPPRSKVIGDSRFLGELEESLKKGTPQPSEQVK